SGKDTVVLYGSFQSPTAQSIGFVQSWLITQAPGQSAIGGGPFSGHTVAQPGTTQPIAVAANQLVQGSVVLSFSEGARRRVLPWVLILLIWAPAGRAQSGILTVLAGRGGTGGCPAFSVGPEGGTFFVDPLSTPIGVAVDQNGKLFVATGANCVFRLDADG